MSVNDPLIGKQLGDYTIQSVLGQGGMARVYQGYDSKLDRYAAVKVIEPKLAGSEDDDEYRERFLREARAIARLHHPRIVGVYQFGGAEDATMFYMAMSFLEGRDLRQILKEYARQDKQLSHNQVLTIVRDIADALDYAHRQGVIHRDVKPSNIMVTADGHAVLTDFGLALNAQEGTIGNTFGSVHYIAPEQAVSSAASVPQSDIYSLGVVLFEILAGRVPFEDVSAMSVALKHISDPPPIPSSMNPKITSQLDQVILKVMEKDPKNRYPNGAALAQALEMALASDDSDTDQLQSSAARKLAMPPEEILLPVGESPRLKSQEDAPTITDSSRARPGTLPFSPLDEDHRQQTQKSKGRANSAVGFGIIAGFVVLALLALIFVPQVFNGGASDADRTATAQAADDLINTATAVALALIPTNTDIPPTETAIPPTETPIPSTNTEIPPSTIPPTEVVIVVEETETPEATPTVDSTPAPIGTPMLALTVEPGAPEVVLIYNGASLVLYNRAGRIDISQMVFVQGGIRFEADEWPRREQFAMNPRHCYQVWPFGGDEPRENRFPADICESRRGVFATSRTFWINDQPGMSFEVLLQDESLAICPTIPRDNTEGAYCEVDLPDEN
ncbi:MAG: protein kinase [Chitinophagaceae bacterium]|nr:protein kinase [Anaerolineae bacterium]